MAKFKQMLRTLLLTLMLITGIQMVSAQVINISGNVSDNSGEPLIGCRGHGLERAQRL